MRTLSALGPAADLLLLPLDPHGARPRVWVQLEIANLQAQQLPVPEPTPEREEHESPQVPRHRVGEREPIAGSHQRPFRRLVLTGSLHPARVGGNVAVLDYRRQDGRSTR